MNNTIIIRNEGSILSQIGFVALSRYFINNGYKVKFDLETNKFRIVNGDTNVCDNCLIQFAFPNLVFDIASNSEIQDFMQYKIDMCTKESMFLLKPPLYISGYGDMLPFILMYRDFLIEHFKPSTDGIEQSISDITSNNSCLFYIGDVSLENHHQSYGRKISIDFIKKSIFTMMSLSGTNSFTFIINNYPYFANYVMPHISKLPCSMNYILIGDSIKAMYLMSNAKYIISTAPISAMSRILSKNCNIAIFREYNKYIFDSFDNSILINDIGGK